jgi:hypothetical protein
MLVWREQVLQRLQRGNSAERVLFAIAAAQADAADNLAIHDYGIAAHEYRELPVKAPLNPERLVARKSGPRGRLVEQMGGALVAGSRKRLVPCDLRAGYARAIG